MADIGKDASDAFIAKWQGSTASELSTAQTFAADLCRLLGVETPHPDAEQQYMFERPITFTHGDGTTSVGRIDLYKRGAFVLEAKKLKAATHTKGFDDALLRARSQAESYARALPANEGRPPFLIVLDVGNRIELYAEFSRSGATYTPFPDPRSHRIALADFRNPEVLERLRGIWTDPLSLDPSRESARVTREIAVRLAALARSLEAAGHHAEPVAQFLMRCLFTMFAEDVRLLPSDSFRDLLAKYADNPDIAMRMLAQLWRDMDAGGFSATIATDVLRFNGKLFKQPDILPLDRTQLALLLEAAKADWKHVEPAIFGTLLERALDPSERHKLGAHYTPRAYVERLVLPTVMEPLRSEWSDAQVAALTLASEGKHDDAVAELRRFHHRLCTVRVLDPACGSGNFLYVTLEHLKRLEGEVLNALDELGYRQTGLALGGERADAMGGETVDPHNLLGIELNPRAAAIAEVVLWIGYLQWHYRTRGDVNPPVPVIRDFRNIENRDAVLAYDRVETVTDERGVPVTRWDGKTMKQSPITGEDIPDEAARVTVERYVNPRKAEWPPADFVVGNPPFIGNKRMRVVLGNGYVEALRGACANVPDSADFVMYWWQHAANLTANLLLDRFGLITTNSIRQAFNRRILDAHLGNAKKPMSVVFAISDHPWVEAIEGAAVRISMSVVTHGLHEGRRLTLVKESDALDGEVACEFVTHTGTIHADLSVGAEMAKSASLSANQSLAFTGMYPLGQGFVLLPDQLASALGTDSETDEVVRPFAIARDLTQNTRNAHAIDFYPRDLETARREFPCLFQWVLNHVKPDRDQNPRDSRRLRWWLFAEAVPALRKALQNLPRYICVPRTAKWFSFQFVGPDTIPDTSVVAIATADALHLATLSSAVHLAWAVASGGTLEDRPRYQHQRTFNPFPFPNFVGSGALEFGGTHSKLRNLGEVLDAHRKRKQAAHPDLTLTGMYNVLEKLRSGDPLTDKERVIHEHGLVSVLRQLHDEIDAAVLDAYGWSDLLPLLQIAHGITALPPSPSGRRAGDEGDVRHNSTPAHSTITALQSPSSGPAGHLLPGGEGFNRLPKAPLPAETIQFARELRRTQTDAEALMWHLLRSRRLHNTKFRRQHPHPPYTLDFYCHDLKLAVELDGSQHVESARDMRRDAALSADGIDVLRYWNHDVLARTDTVLEDIWYRIEERMLSRTLPSPPAPLPAGEGSKAMSRDDAKRAFDEAILERLVALNTERAAEEARGLVRWLRPEFQNPSAHAAPTQTDMVGNEATPDDEAGTEATTATKATPWPKDALEQVRAVADVVSASLVPLSVDDVAARFTARGTWKKRLPQLLDTLVSLGRARESDGRYSGV